MKHIAFSCVILCGLAAAARAGSAVTGTVALSEEARPAGTRRIDVQLERYGPMPATLPADFNQNPTSAREAVKVLQEDEAYQEARRREERQKPAAAVVDDWGRFEAEAVEPGIYSLSVQVYDIQSNQRGAPLVGRAHWIVAVPAQRGAAGLGQFEVPVQHYLRVGDDAPEVDATTVEGRPFKLSALRGKWVVVDFWATWCAPCLEELPKLQRIRHAFPEIEVVGMSVDESAELAKTFVDAKGYRWTHVFLGPMSDSTVVRSWGVQVVPQVFLVDPTGKIAASCVTPEEVRKLLLSR